VNRNISRRTILSSLGAGGASCLVPSGSVRAGVRAKESKASEEENAFGVVWSESTDSGEGGRAYDVIRSNGGYVIAGVIHTGPEDSENDGLLRRVERNGVESWEARYQREGGWSIDAVDSIPGGYVAVANRRNEVGTVLLWYDLYGNLIHEDQLGQEAEDTLNDVIAIDGEVLVVGERSNGDHEYDAWALNYDTDGNQLWEETYFSDIDEFRFECVAEASEGGLWAIGEIEQDIEEYDNDNIGISKLSSGGELITSKRLSVHDRHDHLSGITDGSEGGFIATGSSRVSGSDWVAWVAKFDENGDAEWVWRNDEGYRNGGDDCLVQSDGSILVVGDSHADSVWMAVLEQDGSVRWRATDATAGASGYNGVVPAPGGALAIGENWSVSLNDYPVPWIARLSASAETTEFRFDPRSHAFGFSNWAGETGIGAEGTEFELPYEPISKAEAKEAIRGVMAPLQNYDDLWEGGSSILKSKYIEQTSSGGHCLGLAHAARVYYHAPLQLPSAAATASDVPRPTGTYHSVGELIRENQSIYSHGISAPLQSLMENSPLKVDEGFSKIQRAIDNDGMAPVKLVYSADQNDHAVLVYEYETNDDGTMDLYIYDPNDQNDAYLSPNEQVGVELEEANSDEDQAFENPRNTITADSKSGELVDSTYDLEKYLYLPIGRVSSFGDSGTDPNPAKAVVETLQMPSKESEADPREVTPDALSAIVFEFQGPAKLSVTGKDEKELTTVVTSETTADNTKREVIASDVGSDTSEYTVQLSGTASAEYSLGVEGMDPEGGTVSTTIEESISEGMTHVLRAEFPESGSGNVEITERKSDESSGGLGSDIDETEVGALVGLLALAGVGYFAWSDE